MPEICPIGRSTSTAAHVLGRKLDSIPFSPYHLMIIAVISLVGFVDGYDLVMTGSLLKLAEAPLHLTETDICVLASGPTFILSRGGCFSAVPDHSSRKSIVLIGVPDDMFNAPLMRPAGHAENLVKPNRIKALIA
jgi:hypothetical protein